MEINNTHYTSLWYEASTDRVLYIDQTKLPWELVIREMKTFEDGIRAIVDMEVRGAPLIGVAAAFAMYVGNSPGITPGEMADRLIATRPTAVNLANAVEQMLLITDNGQPITDNSSLVTGHLSLPPRKWGSLFLDKALEIRQREIDCCHMIGEHGLPVIQKIANRKGGEPINILTHCNAGWLATVDYGTALAPVYLAHDSGIPVHVWVDETRPRNQGARLTVYELSQHGVPNTLIVDNAGGHLMQQGKVDLVIVGADRITANGDVVNKIGTYLKALAAFDNLVPFYVAAPTSSFDPDTATGKDVLIEERGEDEVLFINGYKNRIAPEGTRVINPAFDVTPARLITGYLTEDGRRQDYKTDKQSNRLS
ncbi:MAG: S-methyl-5-thioribose-1-phosphate isomerase [Porphyromonadaceae bacterium]|nr:MAG: S-methyl-5-thioribose-1-phosphate isomerase [Porphyromonadaceae bacterium]